MTTPTTQYPFWQNQYTYKQLQAQIQTLWIQKRWEPIKVPILRTATVHMLEADSSCISMGAHVHLHSATPLHKLAELLSHVKSSMQKTSRTHPQHNPPIPYSPPFFVMFASVSDPSGPLDTQMLLPVAGKSAACVKGIACPIVCTRSFSKWDRGVARPSIIHLSALALRGPFLLTRWLNKCLASSSVWCRSFIIRQHLKERQEQDCGHGPHHTTHGIRFISCPFQVCSPLCPIPHYL